MTTPHAEPPERPKDPDKILSDGAKKRIAKIVDTSFAAMREAELAYARSDQDEDCLLFFRSTCFDTALAVMSATRAELKAEGIRGENLTTLMREEIESISSSLELCRDQENFLRELLNETENEIGW